ncbi:hypothetical protein ABZY44_07575 [Streptomyces sp. NPDC006544]|uniref:hypothetical protein n=1 Tax=Streptomyces sp. NPDC006544 TaxID=3154583 RepID=UPI0033BF75F0
MVGGQDRGPAGRGGLQWNHVLLRGDPAALSPEALAPFAGNYIEAPARFLPALGGAFTRIDPWERMVYVHQAPAMAARPARGITVRRLTPQDASALVALGPKAAWIHRTWGDPEQLAASALGWGAFHRGRVLSVACTYFLGSGYEDVAALADPRPPAAAPRAGLCHRTVPGHRRPRPRAQLDLLPRQPPQQPPRPPIRQGFRRVPLDPPHRDQ